jgi:hypothetical protein
MAASQRGGYIEDLEPGTGWVMFAGVILLLVGGLNILAGVAAIVDSHYLTADVLFSNMHVWGWFFLIWGIAQCAIAVGIWAGYGWAAVIGVFSACGNIIAQLAWAHTYPVWAICAIVADGLVIYGLMVYGGSRNQA